MIDNAIKIPTMMTIRELAKETGIAEYAIRQLIKNNEVNYIMTGKKYLINLELFVDYLNGKYKGGKLNE